MKRKSLPSSPPYPPSSSPPSSPPSSPSPPPHTTPSENKRTKLSRTHLTTLASSCLLSGLSKEQVAYEQWVDTQPFGAVVSWEEMGEAERRVWCKDFLGGVEDGREVEVKSGDVGKEEEENMGEGEKEREGKEMGMGEAVGDLGESRWRAVRASEDKGEESVEREEKEDDASPPLITSPEPESPPQEPITEPTPRPSFQRGYRVWTPTTTEESTTKNKPQCPPCARLKRTWTRCRGGPPCVECQHRGLTAEQCQSYDLLNRSRKNRLKKKECKKEVEVEMEVQGEGSEGLEEQAAEMVEQGEVDGEMGDSKLLDVGVGEDLVPAEEAQ